MCSARSHGTNAMILALANMGLCIMPMLVQGGGAVAVAVDVQVYVQVLTQRADCFVFVCPPIGGCVIVSALAHVGFHLVSALAHRGAAHV